MSTPHTPPVYVTPGVRLRAIRRGFAAAAALVAVLSLPAGGQDPPTRPKTAAFLSPKYGGENKSMVEARAYIRLDEARKAYAVSGRGTCVAVIDTGLRVTHNDFRGKRIVARANFTGGGREDVTDDSGSGTHNTGIIAANGDHVGIAPDANIIPLKVLSRKSGGATFESINQALGWVLDNHTRYDVTVVHLSLLDGNNNTSVAAEQPDRAMASIVTTIRKLRENRIAVVVPAGNGYATWKEQGMGFPAILPEVISVGAVYDADGGAADFGDIKLRSTRPDQIMSFSQRLHESRNHQTDTPAGKEFLLKVENQGKILRTDIFAPGALLVSAGNLSDRGEAIETGTSKAAAVVSGTILLIQEFHRRATGKNPTVDEIEAWLRTGGVPIKDTTPNDVTGVPSTGATFVRLDASGALAAVRRGLQIQLLEGKRFIKP